MEGDARHYQDHKDDDSEWGEDEKPVRSERRRLASLLSVRFSPEEEQIIREKAAELGLSVSRFVRLAALRAASPVDRSGSVTIQTTTTTMRASSGFAQGLFQIVGPQVDPVILEAGSAGHRRR